MSSRARVQGLAPGGVRALLVRQPWSRESDLLLGVEAGSRTLAAVRVGDTRDAIDEAGKVLDG